MGNRKLQFAVTRLQFHNVKFEQGVLCLVPLFCFPLSRSA